MATTTNIRRIIKLLQEKVENGTISDELERQIEELTIEEEVKNYDIIPTPFDEPNATTKSTIDDFGDKHTKTVIKSNYTKIDRVTASKLVDPIYNHSTKLLVYIMSSIKNNSNYIFINAGEFTTKYHISKRDLGNAYKELSKLNIIRKTNIQGVIIINHNYIFNGRLDGIKLFYLRGLNKGFTVEDDIVVYDDETKNKLKARIGVHKSRFKDELDLV